LSKSSALTTRPPPYYIQLEFAPGGDLKRWLDERGKVAPLRVRLDLAVQMARALAHVHQAG
jgi:serine/threonine protein kinase